MLIALAKPFEKIVASVTEKHDPDQIKTYKTALVFIALTMGFGGLCWGVICVATGLYYAMYIPFGYVFITIFNLIAFFKHKNLKVARPIQLFFSILLPFAFQWTIGGFVSSGSVMVWAVLALIGLLTCHPTRGVNIWLFFFIILCFFSGFFEEYFFQLFPTIKTPDLGKSLFVVNISAVAIVLFFLSKYFINNEKKLKLAFEGQLNAINSTVATVELNAYGKIKSVNESFLKLSTLLPNEIVGKHFDDIFETSKDHLQKTSFLEDLKNGISKNDAFKINSTTGAKKWINATFTPVKDIDDTVTKIITLCTDITSDKTKSFEFEVQSKAMNQFNVIADFSLDGKLLDANDIFLKATKYKKLDAIQGIKHDELLVTDEEMSLKPFWPNIIFKGSIEGEFIRKNKYGKDIWLRGAYTVVKDIDGKPYKVIFFGQDISEKKRLELRTQEQFEKLKKVDEQLRKYSERLIEINENLKNTQVELEFRNHSIKNIVKSAPIIVFSLDSSGNFTIIEGKGLELAELTESTLKGKSAFKFFEDDEPAKEAIGNALKGIESSLHIEVGDVKFRTYFVPNKDDKENIDGVTGIAIEIDSLSEK